MAPWWSTGCAQHHPPRQPPSSYREPSHTVHVRHANTVVCLEHSHTAHLCPVQDGVRHRRRPCLATWHTVRVAGLLVESYATLCRANMGGVQSRPTNVGVDMAVAAGRYTS